MHLAHLRLRDFRNYARLDVDFAPGFHLLLGDNAQGKTNILEAVYLMATLRSFRGVGGAQMIRHGAKGYFVGGNVVGQGEHEIKMYWSVRERKLALDGQPVKKLADYFGALRTVVFCTEDLQLIKGAGRVAAAVSGFAARADAAGLFAAAPAFHAHRPRPQRVAQAARQRRGRTRQFFPGTRPPRQRNHPRPARTGAEIFPARAAGVSPHFQRRRGIAHRIPAQREK